MDWTWLSHPIAKWGGTLLLAILLALGVIITTEYHTVNAATIDLSWPNCNNLPHARYERVIIGVNGGLDFHPNPCAGNEATLSGNYDLYANTGDPGFPRIKDVGRGPLFCRGRNLVCYSYNYGYRAAQYSIRQARLAGLHAVRWWLDVEADNSWTRSKRANRADIRGMISALKNTKFLHVSLGVYSAPPQWLAIVGHWQTKLPLWLGTGASSASHAAARCSDSSLRGYPVVMTQYTKRNIDFNFICKALPHKYFRF